jgi:hypothetical protein
MRTFIIGPGDGVKKLSISELFPDGTRSRVIKFGEVGYEDYTTHKDPVRKGQYIARHAPNEDWTETGIMTAGFWARWILWNKDTLLESVRDIPRRFGVLVVPRPRKY